MTFRRWLRRWTAPLRAWRAGVTGYFWLPCPMCGEPFGGFETAPMLSVPTGPASAAVVCRVCEDEWIAATSRLCASAGHDPVPIWHGRTVRRERTADGLVLGMCFRTDGDPDEVRCARCHAQLAVAE